MRYLALVLAMIVMAAGCTGQAFSPANLKEVKDFIKDYPNAQIKTAFYSSEDMTGILQQYKSDCPGLGKEGKSYTKLTVVDPDTNVDLVVWLNEDYDVVCSILNPLAKTAKTTTTVPAKQVDGSACETHEECISGFCLNKICSTPGSVSQTTTSTTIASQTTTTSTIVTQTTAGGSGGAGVTTTTAAQTTTTAVSGQPDITVISADVKNFSLFYMGYDMVPYLGYNVTPKYSQVFNITIKNIGTVDSGPFNVTLQPYNITDPIEYVYRSASNLLVDLPEYKVNNIPAGGQYMIDMNVSVSYKNGTLHQSLIYLPLNITIDKSNIVTESNETNNFISTIVYNTNPGRY